MAAIPSRKVRRSKSKLRPSSARLKLIPNDGIQAALNVVIQVELPVDPGLLNHNDTAIMKFMRTAAREIHRAAATDHRAAIQANMPPSMSIRINQTSIISVVFSSSTLSHDESNRENQYRTDDDTHDVPTHNSALGA